MNKSSYNDTKNVSTHQKGVCGENKAVEYLVKNDYKILDRNFRIRGGEIDIIALKESTLVFVEVKSLPHGTIETLSYELGLVKQQKILKTAKYYLQNHRQYNYAYIRFDVLALDVPGLEPVHHIVNAFSE